MGQIGSIGKLYGYGAPAINAASGRLFDGLA